MTDLDARQLKAMVDAARAIHLPDGNHDCAGCGLDASETPRQWPCATAKALGWPRVEMVVRWDA